ncbi:MAG: hypothetical protein ACPGOV_12630 [Magnetovibrionaceae bacterium]
MSKADNDTSSTGKSKAAAEREQRLADALRANLRRRKAPAKPPREPDGSATQDPPHKRSD